MVLRHRPNIIARHVILVIVAGLLMSCSDAEETAVTNPNLSSEAETLSIPALSAIDLADRPLKVIASTSLIGDVVAQVGGSAIELTTLIAPGQDPHSYEPGAQELTAVAQANVIFVNGWNLEESLVENLETIGGDVPVIPISAHVTPLKPEEGEHKHSETDPHVWFDVANVLQWTENSAQVLSSLDPANAAIYQENAEAYLAQLTELEVEIKEQIATLPQANRVLVTNHNSFSYFAHAYDFEILGTVIPGNSTIAEPSASDLATLIQVMDEHTVCTIFSETSVSDSLSQTVAAELNKCDSVAVVALYTETVGPEGSGVASYIDMMRANVAAIVAGLK